MNLPLTFSCSKRRISISRYRSCFTVTPWNDYALTNTLWLPLYHVCYNRSRTVVHLHWQLVPQHYLAHLLYEHQIARVCLHLWAYHLTSLAKYGLLYTWFLCAHRCDFRMPSFNPIFHYNKLTSPRTRRPGFVDAQMPSCTPKVIMIY